MTPGRSLAAIRPGLADLLAGLLAITMVTAAVSARAACRQALALGLDVSGSVDAAEYRLQLDGLAAALVAPRVRAAFLALPETPVRLMIYEWSGETHQRPLIGWTEVTGPGQLAGIAALLRATNAADSTDRATAIGTAMLYGVRALRRQAACWRRTLDISGDGPANTGRLPRDIPAAATAGVTINALVIGPRGRANTTKDLSNVTSLLEYYRDFVLRGPDSFAETARDHADFERVMRRKLLREMRPAVLSGRMRAAPPPKPGQ